jgi:hypothetical protein
VLLAKEAEPAAIGVGDLIGDDARLPRMRNQLMSAAMFACPEARNAPQVIRAWLTS